MTQISLRSSVEDLYSKALLLSAASWFEFLITEGILAVSSELSNSSSALVSFVRNKGVNRQFHTYFDWDGNNASKFFGLFGAEFAGYMRTRIKANPQLGQAIQAFLDIGNDRNRMVHGNYGAFVLDKTARDIYELYLTANPFAEGFSDHLRQFCRAEATKRSISSTPP
ncbi:MAG: hypothetical protein L3K19_00165 [Thermoplasmata archaeon]|nr:hypothetical protein [Thermoplasmata archaeon]